MGKPVGLATREGVTPEGVVVAGRRRIQRRHVSLERLRRRLPLLVHNGPVDLWAERQRFRILPKANEASHKFHCVFRSVIIPKKIRVRKATGEHAGSCDPSD